MNRDRLRQHAPILKHVLVYGLLAGALEAEVAGLDDARVDGTYRDLLRDLARVRRTQLVVISGNSDLDQVYREATALGAFDTIASPCRPADVQWVVIRALQQAQRRARNKRRREPSRFGSPGPVAPVL